MATKLKKNKNLSLMAGPLPPPPLNGPAIKKKNFFSASLITLEESLDSQGKKGRGQ